MRSRRAVWVDAVVVLICVACLVAAGLGADVGVYVAGGVVLAFALVVQLLPADSRRRLGADEPFEPLINAGRSARWMRPAAPLALLAGALLGPPWIGIGFAAAALLLLASRDRLAPALGRLDARRDLRALLILGVFLGLMLLVGVVAGAAR